MRTWDLISELPLEVDGYELVPHEIPFHGGRRTPLDRGAARRRRARRARRGRHATTPRRRASSRTPARTQPLAGSTTLAGFARLLDGLDLWPGADRQPNATPDYRRWAFESAALDLALRQSGLSLADAFRRELRPLRFGVSFGLGDPPSADRIHALRARYPGTHFKLDATSAWTRALADELAATGAVDVVDLKGYYVGTVVDQPADPELYALIVDAFPDAFVEDARYVARGRGDPRAAPGAPQLRRADPLGRRRARAAVRPAGAQLEAVALRHARATARLLRLRVRRGHRAVRRRPVGARRRARPHPAARRALPPGRPERRRAARLQRARDRRRPADEPARAAPRLRAASASPERRSREPEPSRAAELACPPAP